MSWPTRPVIAWNGWAGTGGAFAASGSTINTGCVFAGRHLMPTKLESQTITKSRTHGRPRASLGGQVTSRLPRRRSPTHPGEMLLEEFVKPLGISQAELAIRLGISYPRLNEIVRGKRGISPNTALRLARVVGMSAEFWLGLQLDFDLWQAKHSSEAQNIAGLKPLRRPRSGVSDQPVSQPEARAKREPV